MKCQELGKTRVETELGLVNSIFSAISCNFEGLHHDCQMSKSNLSIVNKKPCKNLMTLSFLF